MNKIVKHELTTAIKRIGFAIYIAWSDARAEYKRSFLGPGWMVLGTLIGIGGMSVVWAAIFKVSVSEFIPLIAIGLVTWNLVSVAIVGAATLFVRHRILFLNRPESSLTVTLLHILDQLIHFAHNLVIIALIYVFFPEKLSFTALFVIPGLLLVVINLTWFVHIIAYCGARYRDLAPLMAAIISPLFLITPVMWSPTQLGSLAIIADVNPLAYCIALVRDPLLGKLPDGYVWMVGTAAAILGSALALIVSRKYRGKLPYWIN